jgi:FMN-dependent oxidoreductase (nitrilotriacetate monooxygenase family)
MSVRQVHLVVYADQVLRTGAWRSPDADNSVAGRLRSTVELAQLAEAAKFDGLLFADALGNGPEQLWPYKVTEEFEPVTLAAAVAMVTERIGFAVTASATYQAPYHIARQILSLDHLSGGRAAWNLVTSFSQSAVDNFGGAEIDHDERYARAGEALEVVRKLWDSFDDDAILDDREGGVYADPARIHVADHHGRYFDVKGPLQGERSVQGQPVLFQAGASPAGRAFAAKNADAIFTAPRDFAAGKLFYEQVHEEVRRVGRPGPPPVILPSLQVVVGSTEAEAKALDERLMEMVVPEYQAGWLYEFGVDVRGLALDEPIPASVFVDATEGHQSALEGYRAIAAQCETVRDLLYRSVSGWALRMVGSPEFIADEIERWCDERACDGFIVDGTQGDGQVQAFIEHVVPLLQDRGRFRKEYTGTTFREHLGLSRRVSGYAAHLTGPTQAQASAGSSSPSNAAVG